MADMLSCLLLALFLILCLISCSLYFQVFTKKSCLATNWPVVGMMPGLLKHAHHIHEYATDLLKENGDTFRFEGGCFRSLDMVVSSNPANVHHILSKNFQNYPKGPHLREILDIFGDAMINNDSEIWEIERKVTMSLMNHAHFYKLLERKVWEKVENGLLPVLNKFVEEGNYVDLQDIFHRFAFDNISSIILEHDPGSLSIDLPEIPCEKAFDDVVEALLYRHIVPEYCWKLQRWLRIGTEKKLMSAWHAFDQYIYRCIELKHVKSHEERDVSGNKEGVDFFMAFTEAYRGLDRDSVGDVKVFLRDVMLNLMIAGRDTTSTSLTWLFWLLATNPTVKERIREEIVAKLDVKKGERMRLFTTEESRNLIYLHGALCEALRLYPPVALEHKTPVCADVLPSGIHIQANTKVILSFYSMGRTESIWGKDCLEFKPERWITERGTLKHEPSYKFPAFHAGPRSCLGKDMSLVLMKMVAAIVIHSYDIQVVEGHPIALKDSVVLQMKHGLMVRLSKRD